MGELDAAWRGARRCFGSFVTSELPSAGCFATSPRLCNAHASLRPVGMTHQLQAQYRGSQTECSFLTTPAKSTQTPSKRQPALQKPTQVYCQGDLVRRPLRTSISELGCPRRGSGGGVSKGKIRSLAGGCNESSYSCIAQRLLDFVPGTAFASFRCCLKECLLEGHSKSQLLRGSPHHLRRLVLHLCACITMHHRNQFRGQAALILLASAV